ncbi:MAG: hypothetical protein ACTSQJ_15990 [Promethearchaeota archaeon]
MNEKTEGFVKNKVITALLQAYHDILDYDGMKSILREAGLLYLKNIKNLNQEEYISFLTFQKLISAQNLLLYHCDELLFEIGQKFSFYLFPYGKNFEDIIDEINDLIKTKWKIEIIRKFEFEYEISIKNCVFCSEIGAPRTLFIGFLINSLQKSISSQFCVKYREIKDYLKDPKYNNFNIILKIEKKNINKS